MKERFIRSSDISPNPQKSRHVWDDFATIIGQSCPEPHSLSIATISQNARDSNIMDASGDQDLKLQKGSPELIAELKGSLHRFLWKPKGVYHAPTFNPRGQVRRVVRQSKTDQLLKLVEPFQEWPQLLDPHLSDLLQPPVSAFIEYLGSHASSYSRSPAGRSSPDIIPLPRAICQVLYLFCKVRGHQVIARFLNNEPKYLEPMLDALETWANPIGFESLSSSPSLPIMVWQERFIMLWWLSHLMLAPFDLASMSSDSTGRSPGASLVSIDFPTATPPIAKRLVHVSAFYLGFASKEREAAGMLLSRLSLKPDMQSIGLQKAVIHGVLSLIHENQAISIHALLGLLSFLAKFLVSGETRALGSFLLPIYRVVQRVQDEHDSINTRIPSSTLARKLVIKISRRIAVAIVKTDLGDAPIESTLSEEALEDSIDHLLTSLEDKDTLVRVSASKALSIVVFDLDSDMASDVVTHLLEDLSADTPTEEASWEKNYREVNAMKWHGLILALSQLIFRRVGLAHGPLDLIERLLPALSFEQRSLLGVSTGANVRDAACLGLWSLARRYKTHELASSKRGFQTQSLLQYLANDLTITATLDPEGNIRRGASAALQEMTGRHPDQIKHGIRLIQVVDYHAVALRSHAMLQVAVSASEIDGTYWCSILNGLLGWRGVGSRDAESRRHAAHAVGQLILISSNRQLQAQAFIKVLHQLDEIPHHKTEERHGLLLALAHIVLAIHEAILKKECVLHDLLKDSDVDLWKAIRNDETAASFETDKVRFGASSASNFVLEGRCRLISATAFAFSDSTMPEWFRSVLEPSANSVQFCIKLIENGLRKTNAIVVLVVAEAAASIFVLLDHQTKERLVSNWVGIFGSENPSSAPSLLGPVAALGAVFQHCGKPNVLRTSCDADVLQVPSGADGSPKSQETSPLQSRIIESLLDKLDSGNSIEMKCTILRALTSVVLKLKSQPHSPSRVHTPTIQGITTSILERVIVSLRDYTINEKGDVGSLVRVEAINTAAVLLDGDLVDEDDKRPLVAILGGLAAERLDKVRWKAWMCLQPHLLAYGFDRSQLFSVSDLAHTSSMVYFKQLLFMTSLEWARKPCLEGYVTSAGMGSESLVHATRAAFAQYNNILLPEKLHGTCMTVVTIFMDNLTNDRVLIPTMGFLIFLFDANLIELLPIEEASWRRFFNQLQHTHYKSSNIPKIEAAVKLYAALSALEPMKKLVLKKLSQMLTHPYAKVRNAAAESLFIITEVEELLAANWFKSPLELKSVVKKVRERLGV